MSGVYQKVSTDHSTQITEIYKIKKANFLFVLHFVGFFVFCLFHCILCITYTFSCDYIFEFWYTLSCPFLLLFLLVLCDPIVFFLFGILSGCIGFLHLVYFFFIFCFCKLISATVFLDFVFICSFLCIFVLCILPSPIVNLCSVDFLFPFVFCYCVYFSCLIVDYFCIMFRV